MRRDLAVLIVTDSFPPRCGGSGWSTYELARGLAARGHRVLIVQPRPGAARGLRTREYEGLRVLEFGSPTSSVPYLRNVLKNEYLTMRLTPVLRRTIADERIDLVHAQHVLSAPPAIAAARRAGVPVVCTVRDYWPVCYWSDLIYDRRVDTLCPACSAGMMTECIRPRAGHARVLALPMIPYMRANLARKQAALARADAVVAVSSAIARDLGQRTSALADTRLVTIPNPVDTGAVRGAAEGPAPLSGPYAVYAGKLAFNKGARKLLDAADRAALPWPLVIVGDGPERTAIEHAARFTGRDVRITGWLPRNEALRWIGHAAVLVVPSHGPESLSRVLLEAGALGRPIVAMDTGGTRDIVVHGQTGLVSRDVEGLAADLARMVLEPDLRRRLGAAAREHTERTFEADAVVARIIALYTSIIDQKTEPGERRGS